MIMRTILLLIMFCGFINSNVKAQNDSLFNYKEEYSERTLKRNNKTYRFWGIEVTPKFESNPCVGKRAACLEGFHEYQEYARNVDSIYQVFFSVPKWKAKLKKIQEVDDQKLDIDIDLYVHPSGKILYSLIYISSIKKRPCITDWFTEEELMELYQINRKVKYDLSGLKVVYTIPADSKKADYMNREYEFVKLGTRFKDIKEKMIKAGIY